MCFERHILGHVKLKRISKTSPSGSSRTPSISLATEFPKCPASFSSLKPVKVVDSFQKLGEKRQEGHQRVNSEQARRVTRRDQTNFVCRFLIQHVTTISKIPGHQVIGSASDHG